jgi:formate-dependent nitrite reductase cytochrome c552 subunit
MVRKSSMLLLLIIVIAGVSISSSSLRAQQTTANYVGPQACSTCHGSIVTSWNNSIHSEMIKKLTPELLAEYNLTEADLQAHGIWPLQNFPYTIGGTWKLRFLNATADPSNYTKWTVAVWQYIIATGEWAPYHPEAPKDWGAKCAQCHVTGFDSSNETFWGTPDQLTVSVECESCHGPGSLHITNPMGNKMIIDVSAQVCGQCHVRGSFPEYELGDPSSFNYTHGEKPHKHHQQFYDWNMSAHSRSMETPKPADFCLACHSADNIFNTELITYLDIMYTIQNATNPVTCVNCHNPHALDLRISHGSNAGAKADEITVCTQCHTGGGKPEEMVKDEWHHTQAETFNGSIHYASGVTCVSCHMPLDTKSAVAYDLRNHTMIVNSYQTYEYSCGQATGCHKEQLETWPNWAEQRIEEIQTTTNDTITMVEDAITQAEAAITIANQTGADPTLIEEAENLLLKAKSYLSFVEADGSLGFHNPLYSLSLLNEALYYANEARARVSVVIPEFTSTALLLTFMIILLAAVAYKTKTKREN